MQSNPFHPSDPDYILRVRTSFARQLFMRHIGAGLTEIGPGHCEIRIAFRPELTQQHGYFHAGIIGTMADNASGYAALSLTPPGKEVLTVEYKLNLLLPGQGNELISRGLVLKAGRTLTICRAEVFNLRDGIETMAATGLFTIMAVQLKANKELR